MLGMLGMLTLSFMFEMLGMCICMLGILALCYVS